MCRCVADFKASGRPIGRGLVVDIMAPILNFFSDVDECGLGVSICSKSAKCINTVGGYICEGK